MNYFRKKRVRSAGKPQGFWGRFALRGMNKEHVPLVAFGLRDVAFRKGMTCLDVGCGGGNTLRVLSEKTDGALYGIDVSPTSVEETKKRNRALVKSGRLFVTQGDVASLPYEDGTFDLVTAVETFYFWQDKPAGIREAYRVLKKGGALLIFLDAYDDGVTDYSELQREIRLELNTTGQVIDWLREAGFTNAEAKTEGQRVVYTAVK